MIKYTNVWSAPIPIAPRLQTEFDVRYPESSDVRGYSYTESRRLDNPTMLDISNIRDKIIDLGSHFNRNYIQSYNLTWGEIAFVIARFPDAIDDLDAMAVDEITMRCFEKVRAVVPRLGGFGFYVTRCQRSASASNPQ